MDYRSLSAYGLSVVLLLAPQLRAAPTKAASKSRTPANAAEDLPPEFRRGSVVRGQTAATFAPVRTTPVKRGEFQVDLVVIAFPDCIQPESAENDLLVLTCRWANNLFHNDTYIIGLIADSDDLATIVDEYIRRD